MKEENKVLIKTFLSSGLIFASGMAFYGYIVEDPYMIWKFFFHFVLFGLVMGIIARKNYKKKLKEDRS